MATITERHYSDVMSVVTHRLASATAEELNSRFQAIRVSARGDHDWENSKTAIYVYLGGLDLHPDRA